jgi:hypothetical protein
MFGFIRKERLGSMETCLSRLTPSSLSPPAAGRPGNCGGALYFAILFFMIKLLEKGGLPADRQDLAGELLLSLAKSEARYELTSGQLADLKLSIAEADRGEFATEDEMDETWKKFSR